MTNVTNLSEKLSDHSQGLKPVSARGRGDQFVEILGEFVFSPNLVRIRIGFLRNDIFPRGRTHRSAPTNRE